MASYIARVELHYASDQDYKTLHSAMERRGFARTITSDTGSVCWLPTGTYDVADTTSTLANALEAAKAAAAETGRGSAIIVAQRTAAMWHGLN